MLVEISTTVSSFAIYEFVALPLPSSLALWNRTDLTNWADDYREWRGKGTVYGLSQSGGLRWITTEGGTGMSFNSGPAEWEDWSAETGDVGTLVMLAGELL